MYREVTAEQALKRLEEGNKRFVSGMRSIEAMNSIFQKKELVKNGQRPFAIVLTCSDSRVPAEILFDQGLGDLFVVRVAGNVVAPALLASIEFAASTFGTALCVVMGHSHCGAVKASLSHYQTKEKLPSQNLTDLVARIEASVDYCVKHNEATTESEMVKTITTHHVKRSAELVMKESPILQDLHKQGRFSIVSAEYDLETGIAVFHDK